MVPVTVQIALQLLKLHLFLYHVIKQIVVSIDQSLGYCNLIKYLKHITS